MKLILVAAIGIGGVLLATVAGAQMTRSGYAEPKHEKLLVDNAFEIRAYEPRIVAETKVETRSWRSGTSTGFGRLAKFIFGENRSDDGSSTKIAMTTPVESVPADEGHYTVTFTMPPEYQLEALPKPEDPRVTIRKVPASTVATLRFSGSAQSQDIEALSETLREKVVRHGYVTTSEITIAQYDPPWIPGPLRRNEVMVEVQRAAH